MTMRPLMRMSKPAAKHKFSSLVNGNAHVPDVVHEHACCCSWLAPCSNLSNSALVAGHGREKPVEAAGAPCMVDGRWDSAACSRPTSKVYARWQSKEGGRVREVRDDVKRVMQLATTTTEKKSLRKHPSSYRKIEDRHTDKCTCSHILHTYGRQHGKEDKGQEGWDGHLFQWGKQRRIDDCILLPKK